MAKPERLEFVTRHFFDLQTIRFAPVPIAMLLAPFAAHRTPQMTPPVAWGILLSFLACVATFYWWSTRAIRRRYGSVRLSGKEALRMTRHPIISALNLLMLAALLWFFFAGQAHYGDVYIAFTILIIMLRMILDSTNPARRRVAWAIGLVIVFTAGPFLLGTGGGDVALAGAVWISLSIFDFLLLSRTLTESVMQRG